MLEVVEQKQQPAVADLLRRRSASAERARSRSRDHVAGVRHRGERHPPHALRVAIRSGAGRLQRKPRLAAAAGSGQRQHAHVVAGEQRLQRVELTRAPEERCRRDREVRPVQALQRRERGVSELVEPLGRGEVLQPVLAEVAQACVARQVACCLRDQHLPSVPDRSDPRSAVHVEPHVALVVDERLTRVQPHPHADRSGSQRVLSRSGGRERVGRSCERDEEGVALRVDLDAVVRDERSPQCTPVLAERVGVVGAELMQKLRRPLDVGEEKGDGAGGKRAHRLNYARNI